MNRQLKNLKHILHGLNWGAFAPALFAVAGSIGLPLWLVPVVNGLIGHVINVAVPADIARKVN